jgi:hypothetical protein
MMTCITRGAAGFALVFALTVFTGCSDNNIALVGRDTLPGRGILPIPDELVATVERLDTSSSEIHLRETDSRSRVIGYNADTRVVYRGREYPVAQLEAGDVVAMQLKQDSRGNSYTDLIRVQENIRDRNLDRGDITGPGTGIQTVDGKAEQLDFQRRSFESGQSGGWIFVFLPDNAGRSDIDQVRARQAGDYVRVERRFLDRERFELETFLRDNR